mmetsp:Transcript_3786/g.9048  ORF Transcript_3786/g.9048 Transcript_3786/m.9048 type:complete len:216 (-) Transcript_3786:144-791(-)
MMYNMNPDGAPDIPRAVSTPEEKALFLTMCPEYCETRYETGEGIPNFETMCHDWNVLHVFPTIIEDSVTHTPFIPGPLFMKDVSSLKIYFDRDYTSALTRERAIDSMPGGIGKVSLDDGVCTHHQTKHPASFPLGICSSVSRPTQTIPSSFHRYRINATHHRSKGERSNGARDAVFNKCEVTMSNRYQEKVQNLWLIQGEGIRSSYGQTLYAVHI